MQKPSLEHSPMMVLFVPPHIMDEMVYRLFLLPEIQVLCFLLLRLSVPLPPSTCKCVRSYFVIYCYCLHWRARFDPYATPTIAYVYASSAHLNLDEVQ